MRRVRVLREALALAEEQREHERGHAGRGMHHDAARQIVHAAPREPAATPDPFAHRRVDHEQPERGEQQHRAKLHALHHRADVKAGRDDREGHLKRDEEQFRNRGARRGRVDGEPAQAGRTEVAQPAAGLALEGERVAKRHPDQRRDAGDARALTEHGEHVLRAHQPAVEERQTRHRHEKDERGGGQNPGGVARIDHSRRRRGERTGQSGQNQPHSGNFLAGGGVEKHGPEGQQKTFLELKTFIL